MRLNICNNLNCSVYVTFENEQCPAKIIRGLNPEKDFPFKLPTIFTPNNDGINDLFYPIGSDINDYTIEVFNPKGIPIFTINKDHKAWDGNHNGEACADTIYTYKISYKNSAGAIIQKFGILTLKR